MKPIRTTVRKGLLKILTQGKTREWLRAWGYEIARLPAGSSPIAEHLQILFSTLGINFVLDVGANRGQFAIMLRRIGYTGKIISFEPVRENYLALANNFKDDPNWSGHQIALGATNAYLDINVTSHSVFSSFLQPSDYSLRRFGGDSTVVEREKVETQRLDDVLAQFLPDQSDQRIFLKMDTQGFDLQVLAGANNSIHRITALQTELSMVPVYEGMPSHIEALSVLSKLGFQITDMFPLNPDEALRATEFDCVCVRHDTCLPLET